MPNAKAPELTELQSRTRLTIVRLTRERGYPPSEREVGRAMGLASRNARPHINALIKKGLVERTPGVARSLRVLKSPKPKEKP